MNNGERRIFYSATVHFQRQIDKAPDFVRVYGVRTRLDAIVQAGQKIRGLLTTDIRGVDLHKRNLVAQ